MYLEASQTSIAADGKSQVVFTVFDGNADVTSLAVIRNEDTGEALSGNVFKTTVAGTFYFYAEYQGRMSARVQVDAHEVVVSKFVKNVCLMEFTDAECTFCPDASRYIDRNILKKNAEVHLMAFHEKDQWSVPQFQTLAAMFKLTATPYAVVDMREGMSLEQGARDKAKEAISASTKNYPAHCAVAVSSVKNAHGYADVDIKLYSEKAGEYYIAVYVVEDGIKGYQKDGSLEYQDYYHQFAVRKMLSQTVYGDKLGKLHADDELSYGYNLPIDPEWNLANTYIHALALDENGYVNNMQVCLLDGGSADYEYKN